MKQYELAEVIDILKVRDIDIISTVPCSDIEDGEITLKDGISIQVPTYDHGLYFCEETEGGISISEPMSIVKILEKIA